MTTLFPANVPTIYNPSTVCGYRANMRDVKDWLATEVKEEYVLTCLVRLSSVGGYELNPLTHKNKGLCGLGLNRGSCLLSEQSLDVLPLD